MPPSCLVRSTGRFRDGGDSCGPIRFAAGRHRHETVRCPLFTCAVGAAPAVSAGAEDTPPPVKGLFLLTDYPAVTVRPGTTTTINLRLRNYALPTRSASRCRSAACRRAGPRRCSAAASRSPPRWSRPTTSTTLQLRLDVPENAAMGTAEPHGHGQGRSRPRLTLPIAVSLAKDLPAKLTIKPQLPSLRGTSKSSFEYPARGQERQRPQSRRRARRPGAAELRDELHRAVRQPGAVLDPDRGRPVQDRQAQGAAAEHDRRQPLSGVGQGLRRGRHGRHQRRARDHRPAAAQHRRPRRRAQRPRRGRQGGLDPDRRHQHRHRRRPTRSSSPAARRAAGRSSSSRRPSTASRPAQNKEVQALVTPPEKAIAGDYAPTFNAAVARRDRQHPVPRRGRRPRPCGASSASASSPSRC